MPAKPAASNHTPLFPPRQHDHEPCLASALANAQTAFEAKGLRLTPLRSAVFAEIAASHHAVGAYSILERLQQKGRRLAPISIYRALDALLSAGVVHRLESRNAYFACHARHTSQRPCLILVCGRCSTVAETPAPAVWEAIDTAVRRVDFSFEGSLVEVNGLCGPCAKQPGAAQ